MNVFFTVDTEFHPINGWISEETIKDDIGRDIDGTTPFGEFGTYFQAEILTRHRLKAVFFVEALSGRAVASYGLRTVVERIRACGHEVGLHLHPEWLRRVPGMVASCALFILSSRQKRQPNASFLAGRPDAASRQGY
jgi:hypothetical protein